MQIQLIYRTRIHVYTRSCIFMQANFNSAKIQYVIFSNLLSFDFLVLQLLSMHYSIQLPSVIFTAFATVSDSLALILLSLPHSLTHLDVFSKLLYLKSFFFFFFFVIHVKESDKSGFSLLCLLLSKKI